MIKLPLTFHWAPRVIRNDHLLQVLIWVREIVNINRLLFLTRDVSRVVGVHWRSAPPLRLLSRRTEWLALAHQSSYTIILYHT